MDQIGENDGSSIDPANMFANQIFEAAYSVYSTVSLDDFDNSAGSSASAVSLVMGGWNGYVGIDGVQGLSANFYDGPEAAAASLVGYASVDVDGTPTADPDFVLAGYALVTVEGSFAVNAGMAYVGLLPSNEYATNGQTGAAMSMLGDGEGWQANPGGGFGFDYQATAGSIALRVNSGGASDPCATTLADAPCNADIDNDYMVTVEDLLGVIGTFGEVGDGTSRPLGDCAPLPNGDCVVNVEDVLAVIGGFGADCTPVVPTGSCCMSTGDCGTYTEADCGAMGGSYLGDDSDCSSCINGACCYGDGSCAEVNDTACTGTFVGGSCADAGCQPVAGACCLDGSTCIDDLDQASCDAFGGTLIDGVTCVDDPCGAGNDDCGSATNVAVGVTAFDSTEATDSGFGEPDDAQCAGTYLDWTASPDVWFKTTAAEAGLMTVSLCDAASYDTSLVLYEGDDCGSLVQVACNGDSTVETGCQAYYSGVYDHPVTAGSTYFIRIGGWQGDVGPGNMTIGMVGAGATGACCVAGSCVGENTVADCNALGGLWNNGMACADVTCPAVYVAGGCDVDEADFGCACFTDGDDSETDCNGGGNNTVPTYTDLVLGQSICGQSSVFVDGPTGGTYRDLDWWHNAAVNAGGTFSCSIGSNFIDVTLWVNEDTGTVDFATQNEAGYTNTTVLLIPAGNWAIVAAVSDWDTAVTCGSGLDTYTLLVE
jgi:hypothetical protein